MWRARLPDPTPPDARTFVAEVDGPGIVGFASASSAREPIAGFAGELQAIYLLAEHRRGGLGRALFARAVAHLRGLAHGSMLVWVLEANAGARRFYEAMGGAVIAGARKERVLAGVPVVEIAYGWRSLPG
jgi:GNAT superfamily N-acetyltransferase